MTDSCGADVPRKLAHRVLMRLEKGAFSHILLDAELDRSDLGAADRRLASRLVYGTMAWQRTLDRLIEKQSDRPVRKLDREVQWALRLVAYQLAFLDRIPDHAIVDESVDLISKKKQRARGYVNAVARSLSKTALKPDEAPDPTDRERKPVRWLGDRYSLPNWLANRVLQSEGGVDRAEPVLAAWNTPPPVWLCAPAPIKGAQPHEMVPAAYRAEGITDELRTSLENGDAFVQDLGAQLISWYCGDDFDQSRVLDACAGLGGKSLHLLQRQAEVTLVDPQATKLSLFEEQRKRLNLPEAQTFEGKLEDFEASEAFDIVLVDAPCSGLGVIRRHPETRWTRSASSILECAAVQADLLDTATRYVKEGGTLVYAVCTFMPEETHKQVDGFLERHPDWERVGPPDAPFSWNDFVDDRGDLVLRPHRHDSDGFYASRLQRTEK